MIETASVDVSVSERGVEARNDRVVAFLQDFALLSAAAFGLWVVSFVVNAGVTAGALSGATANPSSSMATGSFFAATILNFVVNGVLWLAIGALLVWYFVYYAADAETFGKGNQDLTVVDADGERVTTRQRLVRTAVLLAPFPLMALLGTVFGGIGFVFAVAIMGAWLVIEVLVMLVTDGAQRIGDLLVDTYVVPAEG